MEKRTDAKPQIVGGDGLVDWFVIVKVFRKMNRLTITERVKIVKTYHKKGSNMATFRGLRGGYGAHNRPTTKAILKISKKYEKNDSFRDIVSTVDRNFARSTSKIATLSESAVKDSNSRPSEGLTCSYVAYIMAYFALGLTPTTL